MRQSVLYKQKPRVCTINHKPGHLTAEFNDAIAQTSIFGHLALWLARGRCSTASCSLAIWGSRIRNCHLYWCWYLLPTLCSGNKHVSCRFDCKMTAWVWGWISKPNSACKLWVSVTLIGTVSHYTCVLNVNVGSTKKYVQLRGGFD